MYRPGPGERALEQELVLSGPGVSRVNMAAGLEAGVEILSDEGDTVFFDPMSQGLVQPRAARGHSDAA